MTETDEEVIRGFGSPGVSPLSVPEELIPEGG
jgi:hypothetical protein